MGIAQREEEEEEDDDEDKDGLNFGGNNKRDMAASNSGDASMERKLVGGACRKDPT
jgi:hypothetical protein